MNFNFPYFISKRIRSGTQNSFSSLIARIAIGSIAIGIAVMILSFAIFDGFKNTIQEKIFSFSGHIKTNKWVESNSYEETPVSTNLYLYQNALEIEGIKHIQVYSQKACILKTEDESSGAVMKGVGTDFDLELFQKNIIEGEFLDLSGSSYSKDIIVSSITANRLELSLEDELIVYFVQDPPRIRKLNIKGIYETGIEDFDQMMVIGDNRLIQRLNNWDSTQVGGFELFIEDFDKLEEVSDKVWDEMDVGLQIELVTNKYVQFFDWFIMLNRNVFVVLVVILFVACFNIVSITLIMITERTNMIGTLKALGTTDKNIRKIFMYNGGRMIVKGLIIGNILGIGFGLIQQYFQLIPLDPANYYMSAVPIEFNWAIVVVLNILMTLMILIILMIPTIIISRIDPIKSIKFD
ncbi:MAG: FtsX-like permease family protein [Flammeovirgaceae bacterium]|nr:FtsX-like permease family protein [Flammeovirgaceae bacterium]